MRYIIIKEGTREWERIWEWLAEHPINKGIEDPTLAINEGEVWQYMGTFVGKDDVAISEFRHRMHPLDNSRKVLKMLHETSISNEDIEQG